MPWTAAQIPALAGRTALVTGATSGIGYEAAKALAAHGAEVILAVRDAARGASAAAAIKAAHPAAVLRVEALDLAELASVHACAARLEGATIDILLNNAGLGLLPARQLTKDGFELQFGTNHLGHFALTAQLMPALQRAPAPRVVTIASNAHKRGRINFDDLQSEHAYRGGAAYTQAKLANLIFAFELDRRARLAGLNLLSVAAHPGLSSTGFVAASGMPLPMRLVTNMAMKIVGQNAAAGAAPGLYAATMPDVQGGQYWGPGGLLEMSGAPVLAKIAPQARDKQVWARLWDVSERLTGEQFQI